MFGTRADAVVDFAYVVTVVAPMVALLAVRKVREGRQEAHRRIQTVLLAGCVLTVGALETRIRLAGGSGILLRGSPYAGSGMLRAVFLTHVAVAVATYAAWVWLVLASRRRHRAILPGAFSPAHRRLGWLVIAGLGFTTASATAVYIMAFVV